MMAGLIDVSHTVEHGVVTYPGFPAPVICDWLSRAQSRERYDARAPNSRSAAST